MDYRAARQPKFNPWRFIAHCIRYAVAIGMPVDDYVRIATESLRVVSEEEADAVEAAWEGR